MSYIKTKPEYVYCPPFTQMLQHTQMWPSGGGGDIWNVGTFIFIFLPYSIQNQNNLKKKS